MAKFPALSLYTDAYLSDTRHLTTIQHGAYLLLLMTAWRDPDNSLPNDDRILSRYSGMDLRSWIKNKSVIMAFWHLDDKQRWRQRRLDDERTHAEHKRNINSIAGKASALKKQERHSSGVKRKSNDNSTNPNPIPIEKEEGKEPSSKKNLEKFSFIEIPLSWLAWAMEEKGWTEEVILDVWKEFSEYWMEGRGKKVKRGDWMLTWKNRVRQINIRPSGENYDNRNNKRKSKFDDIREGGATATGNILQSCGLADEPDSGGREEDRGFEGTTQTIEG